MSRTKTIIFFEMHTSINGRAHAVHSAIFAVTYDVYHEVLQRCEVLSNPQCMPLVDDYVQARLHLEVPEEG